MNRGALCDIRGLKRPWAMPFIAITILTCCANSRPLIVLDDWWNEDYAKEGCRLMPDPGPACEQDQVQEVRAFERELMAQFASQWGCASVRVARFRGSKEANKAAIAALEGQYWSLSFNFRADSAVWQWQISVSPDAGAVMHGEGDPSTIAKSVCAIVKQPRTPLAN